jgi:hypothetical protein
MFSSPFIHVFFTFYSRSDSYFATAFSRFITLFSYRVRVVFIDTNPAEVQHRRKGGMGDSPPF